MTVRTELIGAGKPRNQPLDLPKVLTVTVTRQDGYAPSVPEIHAALTIALESITPLKTKDSKAELAGRTTAA